MTFHSLTYTTHTIQNLSHMHTHTHTHTQLNRYMFIQELTAKDKSIQIKNTRIVAKNKKLQSLKGSGMHQLQLWVKPRKGYPNIAYIIISLELSPFIYIGREYPSSYTSSGQTLHNCVKFQSVLVHLFRRSCAYKDIRTEGRTGWFLYTRPRVLLTLASLPLTASDLSLLQPQIPDLFL